MNCVPHCVLMTTDTVGGVWTYALELARGLTRQGTCVVLATMGRAPTQAQMQAARAIEGVILECSGYKLEWMPDPWNDVAAAGEWLTRLERRYHPDVIHLNGYAHGTLPWRAPVVMAAHSDVLSWFRAVKGEEAPASFDRYRKAVRAGLHAADRVIAPTRAYLAEVHALYGPLPRARALRNGLEPAGFGGAARKRPVALAAGRVWDEAKNMAVLEAAAASGALPIRIAGDATGPDGETAPVPGTEALGRLEPAALRRELAEAAVFLAPARYEPFGLGVLEAGLSGCALVLADIPTFRELWRGAAAFVDPDAPEAWAAELRRLAGDPASRDVLAAAARERAGVFTAEAMTAETLAVYGAVMQAPAAGLAAAE